MRKSVLPIAIAAATMAMASAFLSTTPAGGETKTLESVALADANWAVLGKPAAPVVNGASGYCLGVQGTAATAGALIAGRHCAGDPAQAWSVRASVTTAAGRDLDVVPAPERRQRHVPGRPRRRRRRGAPGAGPLRGHR
jgi:hypothetical protein